MVRFPFVVRIARRRIRMGRRLVRRIYWESIFCRLGSPPMYGIPLLGSPKLLIEL